MIITFVQSPPRTEVHYNDGAKIFFLSICQSKLVSNWQESSGLKGNIAKNIENIARMEILPDGKYFQKYCGREKLPGDKYFQTVNTFLLK